MEFMDEGSGAVTGQEGLVCSIFPLSCISLCTLLHLPNPFSSAPKLRFVHLILFFLSANLHHLCPLPYPPPLACKTNLIPSWPGRENETMHLAEEGRHTAKRGQKRAVVTPSSEASERGMATFSTSSLEHNLHVSVV